MTKRMINKRHSTGGYDQVDTSQIDYAFTVPLPQDQGTLTIATQLQSDQFDYT